MRIVIALLALFGTGCTAPAPRRVVTDPDPSVKIPAIKQATNRNDLSAATQLIKDLESDDPAVRLYSIEALHRLTGYRMDYHYYDSEDRRDAAVRRWQTWLTEWQGHPTSTPSSK